MNYNDKRRRTKPVTLRGITVGGNAPVSVQSMTNTDTRDIEATFRQVSELVAHGCDIVRLAIPDSDSVRTLTELRSRGIEAPLVADIHYDYKLAVASAEAGADKIRINPGNIGSRDKIREVVSACSYHGIPIRIGVNSGSLEKHLLQKYGAPTPAALAESALYNASLLEELNFSDILISVKASDTYSMIEANRMVAAACDYPLHIGVTEAGARGRAVVKSSVGLGALLSEGIGDTVRVSLTDDPLREVELAYDVLSSLGITDRGGMDIVSCPTCGRTRIDLISLCQRFESEARLAGIDKMKIKVALMGCAVNGPGEAADADIGIAGGAGEALLFKNGKIVRKLNEADIISELIEEIKQMK